MAGLAVFGLKCSSLLDYDENRHGILLDNLRNLYKVKQAPSDTHLRDRLDEVNPETIRPAFKKLFALVQRGKGLEPFAFLNDHVLISVDGTGHYSSGKVSCPHCCEKKHRNGSSTYYHQLLGACVVHPDQKHVIPLCPEVIRKEDGSVKNDCEQNACKRFVANLKREHPHLKAVILMDGLSSRAPIIKLLEEANLKYIIGAKPGDHRHLFDQLESSHNTTYVQKADKDGSLHQYRFLRDAALNRSNTDVSVNVVEYRITLPTGKETNFSWVTNIPLSEANIYVVVRAGRSRWKIENETFNTLKNLGYNFEHNFGHGKRYLSTNFGLLMMLAFLIDQIQLLTCTKFQKARQHLRTYRGLWEYMRSIFRLLHLRSWDTFYDILAGAPPPNTS